MERVRIKTTLEHLEKNLSGKFFRSHRCYLANLLYLSELIKATKSSYEISLGDYKVPLSKYRLKKFKNLIENEDRY